MRARRVDVAIIGAGSAGLAALREVRRATENFVLVDPGPLGTTCARAGCMPSKALIQVANDFHRARLEGRGLRGGRLLRLDISEALAWVRRLRDRFQEGPVLETEGLGSRFVRGRAELLDGRTLRVGKREFAAKRVILATGSRPVVPAEYRALGKGVVTTDELFELEDLPRRIGVVGLGSIGLELGQALSRLGCDVVAFDRSGGVGKFTDPAVNAYAARHFAREFPIHFNAEVTLRARRGGGLDALSRGRAYPRDLILASLGRRPNLDGLGLEAIGVDLDERGLPDFDPRTMRIRGHALFLAGDASVRRPLLHEAVDDGRIAGRNSVLRRPRRFARRAALAVTFSEPNLAMAGAAFAELKRGSFVTGEASFEREGRALILGESYGLLHIYARAADGRFLGAEMIGPGGEHLAHLMAWSCQRRLSVFEMLRMPFYHPVLEEGLRSALRDAARKVKARLGINTRATAHYSE